MTQRQGFSEIQCTITLKELYVLDQGTNPTSRSFQIRVQGPSWDWVFTLVEVGVYISRNHFACTSLLMMLHFSTDSTLVDLASVDFPPPGIYCSALSRLPSTIRDVK